MIVARIREMLAKGIDLETALQIAEGFEADFGAFLAPIVSRDIAATPATSSDSKERKRRADRERLAAKRAAERAAKEGATSDATVAECRATHSATVAATSRDTSRARTQVVISSLPLEEVITPLEEPTVLSPPAKPADRKRKSGAARSKRVPEDWEPNHTHRAVALECDISPERCRFELEKFRDHEFKTAHSDWDAVFRNWLRNNAKRPRNGTYQSHIHASERHAENVGSMLRGAQAALDGRRGRWGFG